MSRWGGQRSGGLGADGPPELRPRAGAVLRGLGRRPGAATAAPRQGSLHSQGGHTLSTEQNKQSPSGRPSRPLEHSSAPLVTPRGPPLPRGATRSRGHADPEVPGRRSGPREALDAAVTAPPRSEQLSGLSPPHAVPRDLPTSESLAPALQRACVWNKVRSQSLRLPWVGEGRGRGCDFLALPSPTPVLPSLRPAGARHREGAWERAWGRKGGGWGRGLHPATWEPLSPGSLTPSFLGKSSTLHTEG